jgi:hypothetical protein
MRKLSRLCLSHTIMTSITSLFGFATLGVKIRVQKCLDKRLGCPNKGVFHDQWCSDKLLGSGPSTSHSLNVLGSIPQKQFDRSNAITFGIAR